MQNVISPNMGVHMGAQKPEFWASVHSVSPQGSFCFNLFFIFYTAVPGTWCFLPGTPEYFELFLVGVCCALVPGTLVFGLPTLINVAIISVFLCINL